jgi:hypothetical protein
MDILPMAAAVLAKSTSRVMQHTDKAYPLIDNPKTTQQLPNPGKGTGVTSPRASGLDGKAASLRAYNPTT